MTLHADTKHRHSGAREARTRNPGDRSYVLVAPGFRIALRASGMTNVVSAVLTLLVTISGCSAQVRAPQDNSALAVVGVDYRIEVTDNPAERRFDLELVSMTDRDLCVGFAWPDEFGQLPTAYDNVALRVGTQTFPMNSARELSFRVWHIKVLPRTSLLGFIGYNQFPVEAFVAEGARTLDVPTSPYFCDYQRSDR